MPTATTSSSSRPARCCRRAAQHHPAPRRRGQGGGPAGELSAHHPGRLPSTGPTPTRGRRAPLSTTTSGSSWPCTTPACPARTPRAGGSPATAAVERIHGRGCGRLDRQRRRPRRASWPAAAASLAGEATDLREQAWPRPRPPRGPRRPSAPASASTPEAAPDGAIELTVPLRIRSEVSGPSPPAAPAAPAPVPVPASQPPASIPDDGALRDALIELARATERPYYDPDADGRPAPPLRRPARGLGRLPGAGRAGAGHPQHPPPLPARPGALPVGRPAARPQADQRLLRAGRSRQAHRRRPAHRGHAGPPAGDRGRPLPRRPGGAPALQPRARRAPVVVREARAPAGRPAPSLHLRDALQQLPGQHPVQRVRPVEELEHDDRGAATRSASSPSWAGAQAARPPLHAAATPTRSTGPARTMSPSGCPRCWPRHQEHRSALRAAPATPPSTSARATATRSSTTSTNERSTSPGRGA